jgi:hypothetical protein
MKHSELQRTSHVLPADSQAQRLNDEGSPTSI